MSSRPTMIKSQEREFTKTYSIYDGSGNMTHFYIAHVNTEHGGECLLTEATYDLSGRPIKTKESVATWDSSWEI